MYAYVDSKFALYTYETGLINEKLVDYRKYRMKKKIYGVTNENSNKSLLDMCIYAVMSVLVCL